MKPRVHNFPLSVCFSSGNGDDFFGGSGGEHTNGNLTQPHAFTAAGPVAFSVILRTHGPDTLPRIHYHHASISICRKSPYTNAFALPESCLFSRALLHLLPGFAGTKHP